MKTETIDGTEYKFGPIKTGVGRKMKDQCPDTTEYNIAFVAESLKAGGMTDMSPEWVDANINYFTGDFNKFLAAAFEANGFKVEVPKVGEGQPPVEAAESTSTTSTSA